MKTYPRSLSLVLALALIAVGSRSLMANDGEAALLALTKSNDTLVANALEHPVGAATMGIRGMGAHIMIFAAAFINPRSAYHQNIQLVPFMEQWASGLEASRLPSNVFDVGNQLQSPPDTAFVLKTLALGRRLLEAYSTAPTVRLRAQLKDLTLRLAEGVRSGGVHTPNHRWAVCSALAFMNQLNPSAAYLERIDEWLAEGLDIDSDGQWSERSPNYNSELNDPAMLDLAILLKRPHLLDAVRRNLEMTLYYVSADGEMEAVASRRQDQAQQSRKYLWEYYVPYRYLAIHDRNGRFAEVARWIERDTLKEVGASATRMNSAICYMLGFPEMAKPLPPGESLPDNYAKSFPKSRLVSIRRGAVSATVFGGSDWHARFGVGSGLSTNPAFFKFRKGRAVLDSVRLSQSFFNTGFFYPQSLEVKNANHYELVQRLKVPYHLPLPPERRRADGAYELSG